MTPNPKAASEMTESELEKQMNSLRKQAEQNEELADEMQREIERRAFVRYFKTKKQMHPFGVGDKLLVTQEYLDDVKWFNHGSLYKVGEIVTIEQVGIKSKIDEMYVDVTAYYSVRITGEAIIMNMRRAYLATHESEDAR